MKLVLVVSDTPGDAQLESLEAEARDNKRGLWPDQQPAPPWEWRKRK
jgi:endonuclease YncB( thermonuclease family)